MQRFERENREGIGNFFSFGQKALIFSQKYDIMIRKNKIYVKEFRGNDILYVARARCANSNYWTVYFDVMDTVMQTFSKNGISFSYPHVNVHMIKNKTGY